MPYKDPEKKKAWEKKNRGAGSRHRVWTGIFYEESAEEGWYEELLEFDLPVCVSPIHDKDVWTARDARKNPKVIEGEVKKAHRHWVAEYPQPVDYATVKEDFSFLGCSSIKYVKSKSSMALYLCHLSAEARKAGKAQYDPAEVLEFGGANWHDWCSELQDLHSMMKEMRVWLRENAAIHHWEFAEFQDWCDEFNDEWSRALDLKCAWAIGNYIERQRQRIEYRRKVERQARAVQPDEPSGDGACVGLSTTPTQGGADPRPRPDGDLPGLLIL